MVRLLVAVMVRWVIICSSLPTASLSSQVHDTGFRPFLLQQSHGVRAGGLFVHQRVGIIGVAEVIRAADARRHALWEQALVEPVDAELALARVARRRIVRRAVPGLSVFIVGRLLVGLQSAGTHTPPHSGSQEPQWHRQWFGRGTSCYTSREGPGCRSP
jgi:hypothetical protein